VHTQPTAAVGVAVWLPPLVAAANSISLTKKLSSITDPNISSFRAGFTLFRGGGGADLGRGRPDSNGALKEQPDITTNHGAVLIDQNYTATATAAAGSRDVHVDDRSGADVTNT
jgi:hypothetical protein